MKISKNRIHYSPFFPSGDYYAKDSFQFPISAAHKSVDKPTVLKNNRGITLFYFRDSHGRILVNSRSYHVKPGCLMCLGAYHYFQLIPDSDTEPMRLTECRLSYDAFLYMAANPYYEFPMITLAVNPLTALLTEDKLVWAEDILDEMVTITTRHKRQDDEAAFYLSMKLMGILQKTFAPDIWKD